jgi:protein O-mannosyl-transferase
MTRFVERPPAAKCSARRRFSLEIVLLIVLGLIAFAPVFRNQFVNWDDTDMILQNPALNPPTMSSVIEFWKRPHLGLYAPLTYTAYAMLAVVAAGHSAVAVHTFALLLQIAAALFVYSTLRRLNIARTAALIAAALFAAHPIQTESVAWAASLNTVFSGALSAAAIWSYIEFTRRSLLSWLCLATFLFLLALLAKPSAVILPFIVLIIELLILRRRARQWIVPLVLWVALAATFAVIARSAQAAISAPAPAKRLLIAADAITFYAEKILLPRSFTIDYGRSPDLILTTGRALAPSLVTLALIAIAMVWRRRGPFASTGILIVVVALLPTLGLAPFRFQSYSTVADRYAYLAMIGVAFIAADLAQFRAARIALAVAATICIALTFRQSLIWHDTYTLANHALNVNPTSFAAHKILAATYAADRDRVRAADHYRRALALRPHDMEIRYNFGNLLLRHGDYYAAIAQYEQARSRGPHDARILKNLAVALARTNQLGAAERFATEAVQLAPNDTEAQVNLALIQQRRALSR